MTRVTSDYEVFEKSSARNRRLLRQEELILEVTERLSEALSRERITKAELAKRLGKTKGFVSQILSGGRNLTLRTVADVADALDCRIQIQVGKATWLQEGSTELSLGQNGPTVIPLKCIHPTAYNVLHHKPMGYAPLPYVDCTPGAA